MARQPKGGSQRRAGDSPTPPTKSALDRVLRRGVTEIIGERELRQLLGTGRPLRLKMGFDPSAPDIHLGHVVGLRKLRQLQELGHQLILIVGDWTARIGDPSGQSATRPMLSPEQITQNAETYLAQFFKVVDRERTQVVWQSQWFDAFTLEDVIRLTSRFTVAQFLQRDDFRKRWEAQRPISLTELLYPLMQAYDSVQVQADVEFGGTDQTFNLLLGRELQQMMGQPPQQCFLVPLLVGTDGVQKMSKSLGNYIGVDEPPQEQYGKVMSLPDDLMSSYFDLLTDLPMDEITQQMDSRVKAGFQRQLSPNRIREDVRMNLKKRLAREIVTQFWGAAQAAEAQAHFERVVQRGEVPQDVPTKEYAQAKTESGAPAFDLQGILVSSDPVEFLYRMQLANSRSAAKRLVEQGSVKVEGKKVGVKTRLPTHGDFVVQVGKRRFLRLVPAPGGGAQHPPREG